MKDNIGKQEFIKQVKYLFEEYVSICNRIRCKGNKLISEKYAKGISTNNVDMTALIKIQYLDTDGVLKECYSKYSYQIFSDCYHTADEILNPKQISLYEAQKNFWNQMPEIKYSQRELITFIPEASKRYHVIKSLRSEIEAYEDNFDILAAVEKAMIPVKEEEENNC